MIPTNTIEKLEECWRSISDLGATLSEAEWKTATDLPGWSVQDNLAHLIGIERVMEGLGATEHRAPKPGYVRNVIGEMNEHEVDVRRGLPGAGVLREWNEIVATRLDTMRNADDAYFDRPAMTPTGPGTVADFLDVRILDCWLHEQDMRRAVDRPGNLGSAAAAHTVDRLIRTIPIVVGKRAATPEGRAVAINIAGGVARQVLCEVQNGRAKFVEETIAPPLTTVELDTESFVVLAAGRRTSDHVVATVLGDHDLAHRVLSQLNMMI